MTFHGILPSVNFLHLYIIRMNIDSNGHICTDFLEQRFDRDEKDYIGWTPVWTIYSSMVLAQATTSQSISLTFNRTRRSLLTPRSSRL